MQVNQYVPHFQRIPAKLEKKDLRFFQEDHANIQNDESYKKIADQIIDYDRILLETLIGNREKRYNLIFKPN